jgi:hypothetical protein
MEEILNILPSWTRWAMSSPKNYFCFWWSVVCGFSVILITLTWIEEKIEEKKRKEKGGKK